MRIPLPQCIAVFALAVSMQTVALAEHRVLIQGKGRLAVVEPDGSVSWEMPWGPTHDMHVMDNGHFLVLEGAAGVAEIDPKSKAVVWRHSVAEPGQRVEVHAAQPLESGHVMIAVSGAGRIVEVNREGETVYSMSLVRDRPDPHSDTRLARKLPNGNYLVAHEADGKVREYAAGTGGVVWEYEVPLFDREPRGGHGPEAWGNKLFSAVRLPNGNTLIATGNGHGVIEVTPEKEIVWRLSQDDLPGIRLAWVTTLEVLENGNYVIGNCHAGPDQPVLLEIEPKSKRVVWQLDKHAQFGNDVSNTALLP